MYDICSDISVTFHEMLHAFYEFLRREGDSSRAYVKRDEYHFPKYMTLMNISIIGTIFRYLTTKATYIRIHICSKKIFRYQTYLELSNPTYA